MPLEQAEVWTARLVGVATLLQTIELLQVRRVLRDDGVWAWAILEREHASLWWPLRKTFAWVMPYRPFVALLLLRIPCALALMLGNSFAAPLSFFTQLAIAVRFRGTFNGGSDSMTVLILLALSVSWVLDGDALVRYGCLAFVAVELTFSYFLAGIGKLKERAWWTGAALRAFVLEARYLAPAWARSLVARRTACLVASWAVILFECTFPLAMTSTGLSFAFAAVGLAFHFGNALVFGLNRFLFAWAAAYPALFAVSAFVRDAVRT